MVVGAATSGQALWYLTRGTGVVTLLLLTLSVVLGIVDVQRWRSERWPRFVIDALHRNTSLLVLVVLVVHVVTSVIDGFAPIGLLDSLIPFVGTYRPIWLGLGALALDLLVALTVTSLLRRRIGERAWRAVHWAAYACWPVALVHSLGTGTDTPATWMMAVAIGCVLAVVVAIGTRVAAGWPEHQGVRATAFAALGVGPVALALWLPGGPLAKDWARRSGTPASLLGRRTVSASAAAASTASSVSSATSGARSAAGGAALHVPFTANLSGPIQQGSTSNGDVAVVLKLVLDGPGSRRLIVQIQGPATSGGGVQMTSSAVTLGTASHPQLYQGTVRALNGSQLLATVTGAGGRSLQLQITVAIDQAGSQATGTVSARAVSA